MARRWVVFFDPQGSAGDQYGYIAEACRTPLAKQARTCSPSSRIRRRNPCRPSTALTRSWRRSGRRGRADPPGADRNDPAGSCRPPFTAGFARLGAARRWLGRQDLPSAAKSDARRPPQLEVHDDTRRRHTRAFCFPSRRARASWTASWSWPPSWLRADAARSWATRGPSRHRALVEKRGLARQGCLLRGGARRGDRSLR